MKEQKSYSEEVKAQLKCFLTPGIKEIEYSAKP